MFLKAFGMSPKKVIDMKQMYHTFMYPLLKLYSKNVKFMFDVKFRLWLDKQNFTKFVLFNQNKTHFDSGIVQS